MMYVVEKFSLIDNARTEAVIFETKEEAVEYAKAIETDEWRVFVTETTGELDDEGNIVFDC